MKKRIVLGIAAVGTALAMLPMFAAFEAHVINVTAKIENALNVPIHEIDFGTVFPQERLDRTFDVFLSQSFLDEDRVDDVDYFIRQKPKCQRTEQASELLPPFGTVTEGVDGVFVCEDEENYDLLPLLCPYLSKHEISTDGNAPGGENDSAGLAAFHGPIALGDWTLNVAKNFDVDGHLAKSEGDNQDTWNIDLKVPCFGGYCAQDWADFVTGINPTADPEAYKQPIENEHKLFGCDLWLEVGGISLPPGISCTEAPDVMLVLDRSSSIDAGELVSLKTNAKALVDTLAPSALGAHVGEVSFANVGFLDTHLTDNSVTLKANIDAITTIVGTNLAAGLDLASTELENPGDGHDRPDVTSPDFIIVITDGNPTVPDSIVGKTNAIAEANAADAAGTTIYVVGVGVSAETETFLQTDIATTPGHYFSAASFGDLQNVLTNLVICEEENQ